MDMSRGYDDDMPSACCYTRAETPSHPDFGKLDSFDDGNISSAAHESERPIPKRIRYMQSILAALMLAIPTNKKEPKMTAFQAQQERERVEEINQYWTTACCVIAFLSVGSALMSMFVYSESKIMKLAFVIPLISAPYIVWQRRQINKAPYFEEDFSLLLGQLSRLRAQNRNLQQESNQLESHLKSLRHAERSLASIVRKEGGNMKQVMQLVKENGEIKRRTMKLEESEKLLKLMSFASRSKDDFAFEEVEVVNEVIQRMRNITSRKLNEQQLRNALGKSNSSEGIYSVGSSVTEDMSEYEPFTFRRCPSEDHSRGIGGIGGIGGMKMSTPII